MNSVHVPRVSCVPYISITVNMGSCSRHCPFARSRSTSRPTYAVLVVKRARRRESGTARESASARVRKSQRQRERTHRRSFVNTTRLLTIYRIVPRDCCETARQSERERASKRERARESERQPSMPSLLSPSPSSSSFK